MSLVLFRFSSLGFVSSLECLERVPSLSPCLSNQARGSTRSSVSDWRTVESWGAKLFPSDSKCKVKPGGSAMKEEQSCEGTQATREVNDLFEKPAQEEEDAPEKQDEMKHVDVELVDVNTGEAKVEKDCCFGEGTHMPVLINRGVAEDLRATEPTLSIKINIETNKTEDSEVGKCTQDVKEGPSEPSSLLDPPCNNAKSGHQPKSGDKGERVITQLSKTEENPITPRGEGLPCSATDQWRSEDDYEEDDDVSLVLSYACVPCVTEDESHYITTHEIQLSELSDHEEDYDLGVASSGCWDIEDDYQVYSFVDYASFEGGEEEGGRGSRGPAAGVSTMRESDLCDAATFPSSDESVSKPQQQQQCSGNSAGQIHLSIRTTRAINDPSNIQEQGNILYHASRSGDTSRYVFRGVDGGSGTLCDRAKCFIAAPGRFHLGRRLRGREVTEASSGASSAASELDDADKEVRNLTARSFKSLAYPYIDAINFSTTSESSSEHGRGINRWSTFVDLKYGNMNMSKGLDKSVLSHQNSSASFELAKHIDNRGYKGIALASIKPPTSKMFTRNGNPHSASSSTKQIELMGEFSKGHGGLITLTETLNFRCNVNSGMSEGEMHTNFAQNAAGSRSTDEVTNSLPSGKGRGASKSPCKTMEDTHKKANFASSLIKNVISKKMQFEQERKMERGEIREAQWEHAAGFAHQESDRGKGDRELHAHSSRFSESSSDYTIMCLDELGDMVDSGSCDTKSDSRRRDATASAPEPHLDPVNEAGIDTKKGALEALKSTLLRSQNSAFRCWKDEELEFQKDHKNDQTLEKSPSVYEKEGEGDQCSARSGKLTKMSHLFVPSIQLLSSDGEEGQQLRSRSYSPYGDEGVIQEHSDNKLYIADSRNVGKSKSPEIKIKLRSFRENTTEHFGVSKLRAPNIGCNAANLGRTDDLKCHELAAALKVETMGDLRRMLGGSNTDKTVRRDSFPNNDKPPPVIPDSLLRSMQGNSTAASMLSLSSSLKAAALAKQNSNTQTIPFSHKSFVPKSPKLPVSLNICPMYLRRSEEAQSKEERPAREFLNASVDNENYLPIPVKSHASINKQAPSADKPSVYTYAPQKHPTPPSGPLGSFVENHNQNAQRSSMVMDTRSPEVCPATIYHSLPMGMSISQPQVYCITPAPIMDPFQATQRKMLLDPTTGNYYLVDTPVQPATKRLFDPETGQYVDVPMPQAPMTPVPMPMSPLAFSPGAYGHHYMIYPGLMSSPSLIPARTLVQSHMSVHSEPDSGDKALSQQSEGLYMESPFYMATGKSPHVSYGPPQQAAAHRQPQGFSSAMQPLISISSQQGPRIIAPPSFDGTTMSFVVEHR
ncbi:hypothetical protein CgunFtcFv8_006737 [Champsocephalus gunnari]|uniref:DUF4585 domain-containing protein n=2 Tax=Champsocephalus gunnari TaxID=52237 RepID=A0AAN8C113_CHAGU|nr:hypothetical protein CgunFtcFv8_006737 [Champsocephalus gunnari]